MEAETATKKEILERLKKLESEIQFFREKFGYEGEPTEEIKKELEEARNEPEENLTSHEDLKKELGL